MLVAKVASVPAQMVLGSEEDGLSGPMVKCFLLTAFKRLLHLKVLSWHRSMPDEMKNENL